MSPHIGIEDLPTDVFPHIICFVPLHASPSVLLSLSLVNHSFYDVCYPLLYSQVILRNEKDTQRTIYKLLTTPALGLRVRGLHIMSGLSKKTTQSDKTGPLTWDAIRCVERLLSDGVVPNLTELNIHLLLEWHFYQPKGYGILSTTFWRTLTQNCPCIKSVILSGLDDIPLSPWISDSGIYELRDFNHLDAVGLSFHRSATGRRGFDTMSRSFTNLSDSLHTILLDFEINFRAPISLFHFPRLRSLSLSSFYLSDTSDAMSFWNRHPKLERIKLFRCSRGKRWFSDDIPAGLLGNLIYFEADCQDVAKVISILPRLTRLGIQNAHGSDLLRLLENFKPMGLPFLKSLEIEIVLQSGPGYRKELDNILKSIESRSPLLEEIGLRNNVLSGQDIFDILCHDDILSGLIWLERIYLSYLESDSWDVTTTKRTFFDGVFKLAQKGKFRRLQSITNFSEPYLLPYPVAKLSKNEKGELLFLDAREGFGMVVGNHDHPFPGVFGSG